MDNSTESIDSLPNSDNFFDYAEKYFTMIGKLILFIVTLNQSDNEYCCVKSCCIVTCDNDKCCDQDRETIRKYNSEECETETCKSCNKTIVLYIVVSLLCYIFIELIYYPNTMLTSESIIRLSYSGLYPILLITMTTLALLSTIIIIFPITYFVYQNILVHKKIFYLIHMIFLFTIAFIAPHIYGAYVTNDDKCNLNSYLQCINLTCYVNGVGTQFFIPGAAIILFCIYGLFYSCRQYSKDLWLQSVENNIDDQV